MVLLTGSSKDKNFIKSQAKSVVRAAPSTENSKQSTVYGIYDASGKDIFVISSCSIKIRCKFYTCWLSGERFTRRIQRTNFEWPLKKKMKFISKSFLVRRILRILNYFATQVLDFLRYLSQRAIGFSIPAACNDATY